MFTPTNQQNNPRGSAGASSGKRNNRKYNAPLTKKNKPSPVSSAKHTVTHRTKKTLNKQNDKKKVRVQQQYSQKHRKRERHTSSFKSSGTATLPPVPSLAKGNIRIVPLGGVEEVGRNMMCVEYGNDIIIVDAGFEFTGDEDTPGIDYLIPNTQYLEDNKKKIRALVITHGHLDHIGAIPYIMDNIDNPPIYARYLTTLMISKRQEEFSHLPPLDMHVIDTKDKITFKDITLRFFSVTHSIPDSMGVIIETPHGNVVLSGDLKVDHKDGKPVSEEQDVFGALGKEKNLFFIADSTNAEQPGFSITERVVHENIEKIIKDAPQRLIIGLFASQFARMTRVVETCEKYGKKVVTEGRSIKNNIAIAEKAGLLKPKKGTIISAQDIDAYPPDKIVVLATGAQGEEFAALMRIATKKHKNIALGEQDTVLLSSSVIPGNEVSVQKLKDNLYRHTSRIIHYRTQEVHSTGHGNQEELAWICSQVKPRFFMPGYGYHSMLKSHAKVIQEKGIVPKENIVVADNGTVIELREKGTKLVVLKEKVSAYQRMVDGFSVGDIQKVVIRDRQMLSQDGMFVVVVTIDVNTGKLRKSPDLISRGFVYLRESQELLQGTRDLIRKTVEKNITGMRPINFDYIKRILTDTVGKHLFRKTNKRPMVIPVILGI